MIGAYFKLPMLGRSVWAQFRMEWVGFGIEKRAMDTEVFAGRLHLTISKDGPRPLKGGSLPTTKVVPMQAGQGCRAGHKRVATSSEKREAA